MSVEAKEEQTQAALSPRCLRCERPCKQWAWADTSPCGAYLKRHDDNPLPVHKSAAPCT